MMTTASLRQKAICGNSDAQFRFGYRLAFCRDLKRRDYKEAVSWWRQAAGQNHIRAQFYLGVAFDTGIGVRRNIRRAMTFYKEAAAGGHPEAQYNLALGYRDGAGVSRNQRMAVRWLHKC